jgi:hypothetical protein
MNFNGKLLHRELWLVGRDKLRPYLEPEKSPSKE